MRQEEQQLDGIMRQEDQEHDGEIFGLHSPDNGRSCTQHACCGHHVVPGNIVWFKREVMEVVYQVPEDPDPDAQIETVIKAVLVLDGTEHCTIGFLPRHVAARPEEAAQLHGKFAQIIELYEETPVGWIRHNKSIRCHGIASYILLDNVPEME
jgi:hypothetical protein